MGWKSEVTILGPPLGNEDGWVAGNQGQLEHTAQEEESGVWLGLDEK